MSAHKRGRDDTIDMQGEAPQEDMDFELKNV